MEVGPNPFPGAPPHLLPARVVLEQRVYGFRQRLRVARRHIETRHAIQVRQLYACPQLRRHHGLAAGMRFKNAEAERFAALDGRKHNQLTGMKMKNQGLLVKFAGEQGLYLKAARKMHAPRALGAVTGDDDLRVHVGRRRDEVWNALVVPVPAAKQNEPAAVTRAERGNLARGRRGERVGVYSKRDDAAPVLEVLE